jgi:hypothetical protein
MHDLPQRAPGPPKGTLSRISLLSKPPSSHHQLQVSVAETMGPRGAILVLSVPKKATKQQLIVTGPAGEKTDCLAAIPCSMQRSSALLQRHVNST